MGTGRYFSWAAYPSIWYARLQRDVLNFLCSFKNIDSYVKFYPNDISRNPNINFIKYKSSKIKLLEKSLIDILREREFDLIITEACATTLLEILCTKSQILSFFPENYIKINEKFLAILEKRVYLSKSEKDYIELLRVFLRKGFEENKKEINDEFLFKFGLGELNDFPAELAKKHLLTILNNQKITDI